MFLLLLAFWLFNTVNKYCVLESEDTGNNGKVVLGAPSDPRTAYTLLLPWGKYLCYTVFMGSRVTYDTSSSGKPTIKGLFTGDVSRESMVEVGRTCHSEYTCSQGLNVHISKNNGEIYVPIIALRRGHNGRHILKRVLIVVILVDWVGQNFRCSELEHFGFLSDYCSLHDWLALFSLFQCLDLLATDGIRFGPMPVKHSNAHFHLTPPHVKHLCTSSSVVQMPIPSAAFLVSVHPNTVFFGH